jgi:hypothetical protein
MGPMGTDRGQADEVAQEGFPQFYGIETASGTRRFCYGGRGTTPAMGARENVVDLAAVGLSK